jgi:hypothetical protein
MPLSWDPEKEHPFIALAFQEGTHRKVFLHQGPTQIGLFPGLPQQPSKNVIKGYVKFLGHADVAMVRNPLNDLRQIVPQVFEREAGFEPLC